MQLCLEQIKAVTQGAFDVIEVDGYIRFLRFTEQETAVIDNPNLYYPAGVQLTFQTDGTALRIAGRNTEKSGVRSYYAFDILENDKPIASFSNLKDEDAVGNYAWTVYPLGSFCEEIALSEGKKTVRILLPHSVQAELSELTVMGATYVTPVKREKTLIAYGDSITQGYDALHPQNTYAMRVADALGMALHNKSLGGAIFDPAMSAAPSGVHADMILVAYGTNDWGYQDRPTLTANAAGFFENLVKQYPGVPIYAVTPIWRKNHEAVPPFGTFAELADMIETVCKPYPTVRVINGMPLVPPDEALFGDLELHPSDAGFFAYAENLLKEMGKAP